MGDVCNPASKKKTDFQKLRGGNHILNIEVTMKAVKRCSCAVQHAWEKGTAFPPSIHLLSR